ncbi:MAG: hypothetical protein AAGK47_07010, partial [Bacteroidota bacterium]
MANIGLAVGATSAIFEVTDFTYPNVNTFVATQKKGFAARASKPFQLFNYLSKLNQYNICKCLAIFLTVTYAL